MKVHTNTLKTHHRDDEEEEDDDDDDDDKVRWAEFISCYFKMAY